MSYANWHHVRVMWYDGNDTIGPCLFSKDVMGAVQTCKCYICTVFFFFFAVFLWKLNFYRVLEIYSSLKCLWHMQSCISVHPCSCGWVNWKYLFRLITCLFHRPGHRSGTVHQGEIGTRMYSSFQVQSLAPPGKPTKLLFVPESYQVSCALRMSWWSPIKMCRTLSQSV